MRKFTWQYISFLNALKSIKSQEPAQWLQTSPVHIEKQASTIQTDFQMSNMKKKYNYFLIGNKRYSRPDFVSLYSLLKRNSVAAIIDINPFFLGISTVDSTHSNNNYDFCNVVVKY